MKPFGRVRAKRTLLVVGLLVAAGSFAQSDPENTWSGAGYPNHPAWTERSSDQDSWSRQGRSPDVADHSERASPARSSYGAEAGAPIYPGETGVQNGSWGQSRDRVYDQHPTDADRYGKLGDFFGNAQARPFGGAPDARQNAPRDDRFGAGDVSGTDGGGYRFRGDSLSRRGDRKIPDDEGQYRFRPLSDNEKDRMEQTPNWRPLDARRGRGDQPGLFDSMTPPHRADGVEPDPWSGR